MDEAREPVAVVAAPTLRLEPVGAPEEIGALAELLLSPAPPGRPRLALHLGLCAPGRHALYFLDHGRPEEIGRARLARLAEGGALHVLRPRALVQPAPAALARYAARHGLAPMCAPAHLAGRLGALAAAGRELSRLGAERPEHADALQAAHGRIERLHNEAAAQAQACLDGTRVP